MKLLLHICDLEMTESIYLHMVSSNAQINVCIKKWLLLIMHLSDICLEKNLKIKNEQNMDEKKHKKRDSSVEKELGIKLNTS